MRYPSLSPTLNGDLVAEYLLNNLDYVYCRFIGSAYFRINSTYASEAAKE